MILIIGGYIAHTPHKYSHLIDIEDKKLTEAIINKYPKEVIHIVSSPGCFNDTFKEKGAQYKLVSEDQDVVQNWVKSNYGKYATIIALSDGCIPPSLAGLSLKKFVMFNTDILSNEGESDWTYKNIIAANADSIDIFYARMSIFRFIQDSEQFYVTDNHFSTHSIYGIEHVIDYISKITAAIECEVELYQPKKFPEDELVDIYNSYQSVINNFNLNMSLLVYDRSKLAYMMSEMKDNKTFAMIYEGYIGTETGRTKSAYDISMDFFKMAVALKSIYGKMSCCVHWNASYNYILTRYTVSPCPFGYLPNKELWSDQIRKVEPIKNGIVDSNWGLIYEEGHGYYLIATSPETLRYAIKEMAMMNAPLGDNEYVLNSTQNKLNLNYDLSLQVYDKLVRPIVSEYQNANILAMNNIDDNVGALTGLSRHQLFFSNPFGKMKAAFNGPMHPLMKYDIILFYGSYEYQQLSFSEQLLKWKKMKSMLTKGGRILVVGTYQKKHDNEASDEVYIDRFKGKVVSYRFSPASVAENKRTIAINSSDMALTLPYSPLENDLLNLLDSEFVITKEKYKTYDIYCYCFKPRTKESAE